MQKPRDAFTEGFEFGRNWKPATGPSHESDSSNPLRAFFNAPRQGRGISKWDHYFDVYHRHLSHLRGTEIHILEIGINAGGSLHMWRDYFGPQAHIYGIDINPACKAYESDRVEIFIGDQADRSFWTMFREQVPRLDIAIDDGGHLTTQQIVSLEELLPYLQPGGLYICEDVHGLNPFLSYVYGLSLHLNSTEGGQNNPNDAARRVVCATNPVQALINSVHLYPYVVVLERNHNRVTELVAPARGTQWGQ